MTLHCESCDQPATRKDACGTALCGRCWSADEPTWLYRVWDADGNTRLITEAQKELLLDAVFAPIPPAPQRAIDAGVAVLDAAFALYCPECSELMDEPRKCAACGWVERDRDEPNYDAPRPLSALENWQRNDEHHQ